MLDNAFNGLSASNPPDCSILSYVALEILAVYVTSELPQ